MAITIHISDTDKKVNGMQLNPNKSYGDLYRDEKIVGYYKADTFQESLKVASMLRIKI